MPGGGEVSVRLRLETRNFWPVIPLDIESRLTVEMVLDTGTPLSSISHHLRDELMAAGMLEEADRRGFYLLRNLRIEGQEVPDLRVRVSQRISDVGANGALGLDFLAQFREIHYEARSMRLTLVFR